MLCFRKHHKDTPPKNSPVAFCRYRSAFVGMCRRKPALSGYIIYPIAYFLFYLIAPEAADSGLFRISVIVRHNTYGFFNNGSGTFYIVMFSQLYLFVYFSLLFWVRICLFVSMPAVTWVIPATIHSNAVPARLHVKAK